MTIKVIRIGIKQQQGSCYEKRLSRIPKRTAETVKAVIKAEHNTVLHGYEGLDVHSDYG